MQPTVQITVADVRTGKSEYPTDVPVFGTQHDVRTNERVIEDKAHIMVEVLPDGGKRYFYTPEHVGLSYANTADIIAVSDHDCPGYDTCEVEEITLDEYTEEGQ